MDNLKKRSVWLKGTAFILLFLIFMTSPLFASVKAAESFMVSGEIDEAIATLAPFVAKEDPSALYLMALIYLSPKNACFNYQKGFEFLEKSAFHNYPPALDELAGFYLVGEGVEKNEAKALHYYIQASHLGYGPGQFNCGIMYKNGQGTEKNLPKAYFYLCLASLNYKDLDDVTLHAAQYRDEVVPFLSSHQRQDVLRQVNALTLPQKKR